MKPFVYWTIKSLPYLILLAFGLNAIASNAAETQKKWKASMNGKYADDTFSTSKIVGVSGSLKIDHAFSDSLKAIFEGGAKLETGSSSALFTDEFSPSSSLFLSNGYFAWSPVDSLILKAGAIKQESTSWLLIDRSTFPTALAGIEHNWSPITAGIYAQGSIPTGKSFTTKNAGKEPTPLLNLYTAKLSWKEEDSFVNFSGNYFIFDKLTHGMAADSRYYGNSISGTSTSAAYLYDFVGYHLGLDSDYWLSNSWGTTASFSFLINDKGPKTANKGFAAEAGAQYKNENFKLKLVSQYYRNEADSSPGFFNSSAFGHNNRVGQGAYTKLELTNIGLEIELSAKRSKLIVPSTFQKNQFDYLFLSIGVPYASF